MMGDEDDITRSKFFPIVSSPNSFPAWCLLLMPRFHEQSLVFFNSWDASFASICHLGFLQGQLFPGGDPSSISLLAKGRVTECHCSDDYFL
jgi:hypothetical protein